MRRVLVAADDITGADDIGVMYYKSGHPALLYPWFAAERASFAGTEKLVVDTDSRFVPPKEAYRRTYAVVKRFEGQGVDQYFSKQCSVFRGNIGAEFDAVLDATGENFGAVVLGFPDNGRTTLHGVHHVHGVPLSESQFRHDPVNPMAESALAKILSAQTRRPVDNVYYEAYAGGPDALRALVEKHRAAGGYLIFDVRDNADLQLLAGVLKEVRVICGSSAIAYWLGLEENAGKPPALAPLPAADGPVLCAVGSLTPQTAIQVETAQLAGTPVLTLDTRRLFTASAGAQRAEMLERYALLHAAHGMVILESDRSPEGVAATKAAARAQGLDDAGAATAVSEALAEITHGCAKAFGLARFIVCGGDTSAAFCRRFGIAGMRVGPEIEPGVSVCLSEDDPRLRFVLKSGSFGTPAFLGRAAQALGGAAPSGRA